MSEQLRLYSLLVSPLNYENFHIGIEQSWKMQISGLLKHYFELPQWTPTILLVLLCQLTP